MASDKNYNKRKVRTTKNNDRQNILTDVLLENCDISMYFKCPCMSDMKMFLIVLIKPRILDIGLYKVSKFLDFFRLSCDQKVKKTFCMKVGGYYNILRSKVTYPNRRFKFSSVESDEILA